MSIKQEVTNDLLNQFTTLDTGEDKRGVIYLRDPHKISIHTISYQPV